MFAFIIKMIHFSLSHEQQRLSWNCTFTPYIIRYQMFLFNWHLHGWFVGWLGFNGTFNTE